MIAYKGFNKNLQCRNYQFKIGEVFTHEGEPKVCRNGFHFCYKLGDVFSYYGRSGGNRFCVVEVLGEVVKDGDKGCTNKIRIVQEIDVYDELLNNKVQQFLQLQHQFPDLIIGGSMSLILQGKIPNREIGDIDIVSHRYFEFEGATIIGEARSEDNDALKLTVKGESYDYFIIPNVIYKAIEYRGNKIKVQSPSQIMEAKFKYYNKGVTKHKDDIIHYLNGYKPTELARPDEIEYSDLPF
jgi:hypothetical protein